MLLFGVQIVDLDGVPGANSRSAASGTCSPKKRFGTCYATPPSCGNPRLSCTATA